MRLPRPAPADGDGGYLLVELLVVISLMAVVGGLLGDAVVSAFHSQRDITARATDLNGLRQAMERTTRDMRGAGAVCVAQPQLLELESPGATGGTVLFTWSIATAADGTSSLVESQAPDSGCRAGGASTGVTVLADVDPATALFGYSAKPGYASATPGSVDSYCRVVATGATEQRCVGVVGIDLKALLPGHPDMELADTVELRNVT